jgi:endoglucanase
MAHRSSWHARVLAACLALFTAPLFAQNFNYAEALQKSLYFYEVQRAGDLPATNRVNWRGDAALGDGSDVNRDLTGGWFDAGDHVKFGLPMAYTATMLAWGIVEYRSAYVSTGQLETALDQLKWATDYFIKAHPAPNELYGQIGLGDEDHRWWGPAEVMQMPRPSFKITSACPGSDLAGETAAAMAAASLAFRPTNPTYANTLLTHARQLYTFADTFRGRYSECITDAAKFYNSWSGFNDELAWGALWMYRATNEQTYLDKALAAYANFSVQGQNGTVKSYKWTHNWDDKAYGSYVLFAKLTGEQRFHEDTQRWLNYWTVGGTAHGADGTRIAYSPGGQAWLDVWGSLRYSANTAFLALVYADSITNTELQSRYRNFALGQVNYILGNNPRNWSYMIGFGTNWPKQPHHRTAHASWSDSLSDPVETRHTLFGALIGGPAAANDSFIDERNNFQTTEVATDYNAALTGALARLAQEYNKVPLANFPQPEPVVGNEIFAEAALNAIGPNFTEVKVMLRNRSAWPARMGDKLSFRYFFTLEPGVTPSQITLNANFNQCLAPTGPHLHSGNVYYVNVSCNGVKIYPGGQSAHRAEVQFRIASSGAWDPANDWSIQGVATTPGSTPVLVQRIPVYDNGVRVFGSEPGPVTPDTTPPTLGAGAVTTSGTTLPIVLTWPAASDASGIARYEVRVDGVLAGQTTTTSFTLTGLAVGSHTAQVTAVDGAGLTASYPAITFSVAAPPGDFSISTSVSGTVARGGTATATIAINRTNFTGPVTMSVSGLPSGVTVAFNPSTATTGNTVTATYTASATATLGATNVLFTATSGTVSRTASVALTVAPAPGDFTITPTNPAAVTRGSSGSQTLLLTRTSFTGNVSFTASGLPAGVTVAFSPNPSTATSGNLVQATFTASSTATLGTFNVTITATSGALTRTTTMSLTVSAVVASDFTVASSGPLSVARGASGSSTLTLTRTNFTGAVTMSATGLPAGVTVAFNPATATTGNSVTATFTASATATLGTANVTINAVSGTTTRSTTVALTVTGGGTGGTLTATPVVSTNSPWFNELQLRVANTGTLTALTVTVVVQRTPGVNFSGMYNTVGGQVTHTNVSTASTITYTFTLAAGQTLPPSTSRMFAIQTSGGGTLHPTSGDTYSVTYTSGGVTTTTSGNFP